MTTTEVPTEKRTRKTVDRNAFASAMGTVSDAAVKPKTTATSSFNPLFEAFEDSWHKGSHETFKRNVGTKDSPDMQDVQEWTGQAKTLTIESDRVDDAKQLVMDAAKRMNVGYRFRAPENEAYEATDGIMYSTIYFWAHEKSERKRKDGSTVPEGQAEQDEQETQPA